MRAPYQILAIPYRIVDGAPIFCVMHRSDEDWWQFIAGGGEDGETPKDSAKREILEEGGVQAKDLTTLTSMAYLPANYISEGHRKYWPSDTYVLPEYHFAFECNNEITLSSEHTELCWVDYDKAVSLLKWDSNKTALYELMCRLGVNPTK